MELNSLDIATFSPGVITVHHGSEPLYPAVVVTQPDSPFRWARENHFEIGYSAYDPDGSGKVKLEAFSEDDESDLMLIADDLPAVSAGTFDWSTLGLPEADYTLRATVTDGRGMSFVAHARFFLLVTDVPVRPDAGVADGGADAGTISPEDAGPADSGKGPAKMTDGGGCTCTVGQAEYPLGLLGLFLAAVLLRVRRKK
jgi:MYXO-CTERM domain-containing protein